MINLWDAAVYVAAILSGAPWGQPTVKLDRATVIGTTDGILTQYLGIPFAQPPVGKLRLQLPHPILPYSGVINATTYGNQCIQQAIAPPHLPSGLPPEMEAFLNSIAVLPQLPQSEDCLNINVIVPAGTKPGADLPVAVWIYGGAFQVGSNAGLPGEVVVNRSIALGQPVIFVSMNYRLSAFGFLGGREVMQAGIGNLGLQDQREALRWVQRYISSFGGDPTKVTIWGESAGAISAVSHMITNGGDTEGLFRAAWMESGSVVPSGNITKLQSTFDFIAAETGCASAQRVLECLREVPARTIKAAMDKTPTIFSYQSLNIPWVPHADGVFLQDYPMRLVLDDRVADVPFVIGDCLDEGTLVSLTSFNVTTDDEFVEYVRQTYFPQAPASTFARLQELYPADPTAGSPFGTGDAFAFTRQYKRLAAVQGDFFFESMRRFLLKQRSGKSPVWSFMSERNQVKGMGATHSTELANVFGGGDMTDFLIRFVHTLDPNGRPGSEIHWPAYTPESPRLLAFVEGEEALEVIPDTFREEAMDFLVSLALDQPM
ncbi:carotenoid ester lipase precursor [Trametes punicea]|nr:carotenoid ester lipase precursor [Trametes punicea]